MMISVVIATHNRAHQLTHALKSLAIQTLPQDVYEVIVVDNASRDATRDVIETAAASLPVRYCYDAVLGLSHARNIGWHEARAPYVAFLDDDATAYPAWLETLLLTFRSLPRERHTCVGGKVELAYAYPRPSWLADELLFCLGALDRGPEPVDLNASPYFLHGCNMAFPKRTLAHFGGFPETLGRSGDSLRSGEEIFLQRRIEQNGGVLYYHPDAGVTHHISKARLTRRWFLLRMFAEGRSSVHIERALMPGSSNWRTELHYLLHDCINRKILLLHFPAYCRAATRLGRFVGSLA